MTQSSYTLANQREYVDVKDSIESTSKIEHCITVPIFSSDPLIIVQAEIKGDPYNRFKVEVLSGSSINSSTMESFLSSDISSVRTSEAASQMGFATLRIKPTANERKSSIKVIYGPVDGVNVLYIYNKNQPYTPPPTIPPLEPPNERPCGTWVNGVLVCVNGLSEPSKPSTNYSLKKFRYLVLTQPLRLAASFNKNPLFEIILTHLRSLEAESLNH